MNRQPGQIPAPAAPYSPIGPLEVNRDKTFRLRLKDANQAYVLLKFLLTKFYLYEDLDRNEETVFYLVVEFFRTYRNLPFYEARKEEWLTLSLLASLKLEFPDRKYPNWANAQRRILLKNCCLYSPRAFLGLKLRAADFLSSVNRTMRRSPPPQRRVGVGYRDKGTASVPHHDGNPSWQLVASQRSDGTIEWNQRKLSAKLAVFEIKGWPRRHPPVG